MTNITLTGIVKRSELVDAWPEWASKNGCVDITDPVAASGNYPYSFILNFHRYETWDVRVMRVDRVRDPASVRLNDVVITVDPSFVTEDILSRLPEGFELDSAGNLTIAYVSPQTSGATQEERMGFGPGTLRSKPSISVSFHHDDIGTPIFLAPAIRNSEPMSFSNTENQVTITAETNFVQTKFLFGYRKVDILDADGCAICGDSLWDWIASEGKRSGFFVPEALRYGGRYGPRTRITAPLSKLGGYASAIGALGVSDIPQVQPVAAARGSRALIIEDEKTIADAPERSVFPVEFGSTSRDVIALGLSGDHSQFVEFDVEAHMSDLPSNYDRPRASAFWDMPVDRFVFQRSDAGFHGLFILKATAFLLEDRKVSQVEDTDRVWFAYCIPVFLPHSEAREVPTRFRRLSDDFRKFISKTSGLADFLNQALLSLKGAFVKMNKAGITLYGFELSGRQPRKYELPKTHLLRTFGLDNFQSPYEAEKGRCWTKKDRQNRGYFSSRASLVAAQMCAGHISSRIHAQGSAEIVMDELGNSLQPVASSRAHLRVLEV